MISLPIHKKRKRMMTPKIKNDALRRWLAEQLESRHMTAHEASKEAGLSRNYINDVLGGQPMGAKGAKALAAYFNTTVGKLLEMEGSLGLSDEAAVRLALEEPVFKELAELWPRLKEPDRRVVLRTAQGLIESDS